MDLRQLVSDKLKVGGKITFTNKSGLEPDSAEPPEEPKPERVEVKVRSSKPRVIRKLQRDSKGHFRRGK